MQTQPNRARLTAARIAAFTCPPGKTQAFLWDSEVPGMGLRTSAGGRKSFILESRLRGKTLRLTIGDAAAWPLGAARTEALRLKMLVDTGIDPRELARQQDAERETAAAQAAAEAVTMGEAWAVYVEDRRPHWGERHYADNLAAVRAGGEPFKRGQGVTVAGPLHSLLGLRLADLDTETVEQWAGPEGDTRPTQARLALRLLRAFLGWCAEHPRYRDIMPAQNPAKSRRARQSLGKPQAKHDALLREQLPGWFQTVRAIGNPTISAYLQALLLTGARPGEMLALRWEDVNAQWRGLTIRDKVEGERVIPLCPYVHHLLASLPRRGEWVFQSATRPQPVATPRAVHLDACRVAGIEHLTLHGLRRSFGSLAEWLELPAGVTAQIMGHKPSATAEKHYRVRPLDLLRVHHEKLERWILEQAGVQFDASKQPGKLRAVGRV